MILQRTRRSSKPFLIFCMLVLGLAGVWAIWAYGGEDHLSLRGQIVMDTFDGVAILDLQTHELDSVAFEEIDRPRLGEVNPGPQRGYLVSGVEYDRSHYEWRSRAYLLDADGQVEDEWSGMSAVYVPQSERIVYLVRESGDTWKVRVSEADNPENRSYECGERGFPAGPDQFDPWRDSRFLPGGLVPCGADHVCFLTPRGTIDTCDTTTLEVISSPTAVECLPRVWLAGRQELLCETRDGQMRIYDPRTGDLRHFDYTIHGHPIYIPKDQVLLWAEISFSRSLVREALTWTYLSLPSGTMTNVRFQRRAPAFWRPP